MWMDGWIYGQMDGHKKKKKKKKFCTYIRNTLIGAQITPRELERGEQKGPKIQVQTAVVCVHFVPKTGSLGSRQNQINVGTNYINGTKSKVN